MDDLKLAERVAQRYASSPFKWVKIPGSVVKMTQAGMAMYARSEDDRFRVYVDRYLTGDPGRRAYQYWYSAEDRSLPMGRRDIPMPKQRSRVMDPKVAMAAVEEWARQHPAT